MKRPINLYRINLAVNKGFFLIRGVCLIIFKAKESLILGGQLEFSFFNNVFLLLDNSANA